MKKFFASAFYSDHKHWNHYGWWSYEKSCRNGSRQRCFKILVAAVKVAGLVETWAGKGPFTPFALKNEAFAKLPESTVESLLEPEKKDKLISILTYHVIPGKVLKLSQPTKKFFLWLFKTSFIWTCDCSGASHYFIVCFSAQDTPT